MKNDHNENVIQCIELQAINIYHITLTKKLITLTCRTGLITTVASRPNLSRTKIKHKIKEVIK
jgi:hypothetical protein